MTSSPTKSFAEFYQRRVSRCDAGKITLFEQNYNEQKRLAHFSEKQGFSLQKYIRRLKEYNDCFAHRQGVPLRGNISLDMAKKIGYFSGVFTTHLAEAAVYLQILLYATT